MKFMVILKGEKYCEPGTVNRGLLADMTKYNHALIRAGILVAAEGLHPSAGGVRVERSGGKKTVKRGPFAEPNDLVAGVWVWQTASLNDAIEWVKRCPLTDESDARIEIRQLFDFEDFRTGAESELNGEQCAEPLAAA
jgi:hypothetical protein